ncbi:MAG: hypothetical protein JW384_00258 [Nitrosomonadaceae bacterium]|nr:hypothetical protein [Nitrosomonadaceae bacterium]
MIVTMAQDQVSSLFDDQSESTEADQDSVPAIQTPAIVETQESVPATYDIETADGVLEAAEKSAAMKNYLEKVRLDTANAERQRLASEMRQQQGSINRAQAYHEYIVNQLNNGVDPEELAKQTPLYVAANESWTRAELNRILVEEAIASADEDQRDSMRIDLDNATSANDMRALASKSLVAMRQKVQRDHLAELDPSLLAEHPRFKDWLQDQVTKRVDEELNAQKTQSVSSRRVNAPNIPVGSAPSAGINPVEFSQMSPRDQERMLSNLTPQQEDALMTSMYEAARKGQ